MKPKFWTLLLLGLASSCVLPELNLVTSFDEVSGGTSGASSSGTAGASSGGAATSTGGSESDAGEPSQGGVSTSGAGGAAAGGTPMSGGSGGSSTSGGKANGGTGGLNCPPEYDDICEGLCTVTRDNVKHCGACFEQCLPTEVCVEGECGCHDDQVWCVDECTLEDSQHCGEDCVACAGVEECAGGACKVCPEGCALLSAPFPASGDHQVTYQVTFDPPVALEGGVGFRYNAATAPQVWFTFRVFNAAGQSAVRTHYVEPDYGWYESGVDFAASGYDFSATTRIEITLFSAYTNPTLVYLDRIRSGGTVLFDFANDANAIQLVPAKSTVTGTVTYVRE